ncbi:hypothetical protein FNV65_06750 [Streptomyces sp. S1A1-8]|uniref:hypothetical protein n=1 Tax=unclassified Streptomyces TaxID=2593676 RepID=UPI0011646D3F|nr:MULTISPECIES: hypothetical protein [unclassified Streptomyces]QDN96030.1 hypothetical protein FNV58_08175 [Streptomyces sp. RLB1-9]QDO17751.1 hypothetical protein FNV65_06750 [Streptomyces sp. S1A1-8]QDO27879.1 hypothetical protein FNV63_06760 [Streptomyces sp. S1A1-3]
MAALRLTCLRGPGAADEALGAPVQVPMARVHRRPRADRYELRWRGGAEVLAAGPSAARVPVPGQIRPVAGTGVAQGVADLDVLLVSEAAGVSGLSGSIVAFTKVFELDSAATKFTRTVQFLEVVRGTHELEEYVADGAGDDRADQHAGDGVGDGGVDGKADHGPRAIGREGRDDQAPSLLTILRGHLNSRGLGLV